jgi:hypothetical protein
MPPSKIDWKNKRGGGSLGGGCYSQTKMRSGTQEKIQFEPRQSGEKNVRVGKLSRHFLDTLSRSPKPPLLSDKKVSFIPA